jgi:hypothetical protein
MIDPMPTEPTAIIANESHRLARLSVQNVHRGVANAKAYDLLECARRAGDAVPAGTDANGQPTEPSDAFDFVVVTFKVKGTRGTEDRIQFTMDAQEPITQLVKKLREWFQVATTTDPDDALLIEPETDAQGEATEALALPEVITDTRSSAGTVDPDDLDEDEGAIAGEETKPASGSASTLPPPPDAEATEEDPKLARQRANAAKARQAAADKRKGAKKLEG